VSTKSPHIRSNLRQQHPTHYQRIEMGVLHQYAQDGMVKSVQARRVSDGYWLVVAVQSNKYPLLLYSQRHHPRAWASLDRLVAYVRRLMPEVKHFDVEIHAKGRQAHGA
jgi:hypothetical protein